MQNKAEPAVMEQGHPLVELVNKEGVEEVALWGAAQLAHLHIPFLICSTTTL